MILVPNYWQTNEGKNFLSSGSSNCATEAQKTLPKLESVADKMGEIDGINQREDIAEEIVTTAITAGHSLVNTNGDSFETSKGPFTNPNINSSSQFTEIR